ncbi:MAG: enoyl-CoA hydratase-related protein [Nitrospinota bacterium]
MKCMRQSTLETLGLGTVLDIFKRGQLPADAKSLVEQVFGEAGNRGALVISGANGIVGAGKTMQLGSRLKPYNVPIACLDFPGSPDGIGSQYNGLKSAFGKKHADEIMSNIIRFNYDGSHLPDQLKELKPRFLLEAIPEILDIKKAHYSLFKKAFPNIEIRSVTSGFPKAELNEAELNIGIAHPAFPHQINKVWEVVESEPSPVTQLFWSLGLIPIPVSDHWSFVLDVLFCGLTLAGLRYHRVSNMPFWKIDKLIRKMLGPNPFRAHDAIGAKGANFLTWSCLYHLSKKYGALFTPAPELEDRKEGGQNWYPLNHLRPLVDWTLKESEEDEMHGWILGPMIQMTSLMLQEKRAHLTHINAIGELCAQFRKGILAVIRNIGADSAIKRVEEYHRLYPKAAESCWYPDIFESMEENEWQQLYVNAEHDGNVGVITISRESYNNDVDKELNRAIDWLKAENIEKVIVTGDFHLSTQMVGADINEFFQALDDASKGMEISISWSQTTRRLNNEFKISVGFLNGKRCLGGFLELLMHCHYLVSKEDGELGMPEVTLPVVPGMEGCHWPYRKASPEDWPKLHQMLLSGKSVKAKDAVGWLIDYAGTLEDSLQMVWKIATEGDHGLQKRTIQLNALKNMPTKVNLPDSRVDSLYPAVDAARKAIMSCIQDSCNASLSEALTIQAKHSAKFMSSSFCRSGRIGLEAVKMNG